MNAFAVLYRLIIYKDTYFQMKIYISPLSSLRPQSTASREIQEGSTHKPGIGLAPHHSISTAKIPGPNIKPQMETVVVEDHALVLFDLETTGLGSHTKILL